MLTLLQHTLCPLSRFVRLVLNEYGIDVRLVEERFWERREDFLRINPAGSIPVLITDGEPPIPGTAIIAEYIQETLPADERDDVKFRHAVFGRRSSHRGSFNGRHQENLALVCRIGDRRSSPIACSRAREKKQRARPQTEPTQHPRANSRWSKNFSREKASREHGRFAERRRKRSTHRGE